MKFEEIERSIKKFCRTLRITNDLLKNFKDKSDDYSPIILN
jgi:hypothetical protein